MPPQQKLALTSTEHDWIHAQDERTGLSRVILGAIDSDCRECLILELVEYAELASLFALKRVVRRPDRATDRATAPSLGGEPDRIPPSGDGASLADGRIGTTVRRRNRLNDWRKSAKAITRQCGC